MTPEKKYRIMAPVGSNMVPNQTLDENQLRQFSIQIIQDPNQMEVWKEKILKDPIDNIVQWLEAAGYAVEIR